MGASPRRTRARMACSSRDSARGMVGAPGRNRGAEHRGHTAHEQATTPTDPSPLPDAPPNVAVSLPRRGPEGPLKDAPGGRSLSPRRQPARTHRGTLERTSSRDATAGGRAPRASARPARVSPRRPHACRPHDPSGRRGGASWSHTTPGRAPMTATTTRTTIPQTLLRLAGAALAAVGLFAGLAGLGRPAAAAGDCGGAPTQQDAAQAAQLLGQINAYRQQNGVAALTADGALSKAAGWMARDMVGRKDGVGHTDALGRGIGPRLADCGYTGFAAVSFKENVCCTVTGTGSVKTPEQAFEAWRTSTAGHNEAMLDR